MLTSARQDLAKRTTTTSSIAISLSRINRRTRSSGLKRGFESLKHLDRDRYLAPDMLQPPEASKYDPSLKCAIEARLWFLMRDKIFHHGSCKNFKALDASEVTVHVDDGSCGMLEEDQCDQDRFSDEPVCGDPDTQEVPFGTLEVKRSQPNDTVLDDVDAYPCRNDTEGTGKVLKNQNSTCEDMLDDIDAGEWRLDCDGSNFDYGGVSVDSKGWRYGLEPEDEMIDDQQPYHVHVAGNTIISDQEEMLDCPTDEEMLDI